ncbi:MAG: hypothetical protein AB1Z20_03860 [Desulfobacterales bacterium]
MRPVRTCVVSEEKKAYFRESAAVLQRCIPVPLILVGGIRSFRISNKIVTTASPTVLPCHGQ